MRFDPRPIPPEIREFVSYDPASGHLFRVRTRGLRDIVPPRQIKAANKLGYVSLGFRGHSYPAHRVAWFLHYGTSAPDEIDHINGDPGDNRIANLRLATRTTNSRNIPARGRVPSKGVVARPSGKFASAIRTDEGRIWLGTFDTEAAAAAAYREAAINYHGEFARLQ